MRLLVIGDSPALHSGQARMIRELSDRFYGDGVDVVVAGWFHLAAQRRFDAPYEILPTPKEHPEQLEPILQRVRPDAVLAIGDPWEFIWLAAQRAAGAPWLLYGYMNVEFCENPPKVERAFDGFDDYRITSEAGARVVGRGAKCVHLGVDTKMFYPVTPRPARVLGHALTPEHVVILVNAQNRPRKNLGACIYAISQVAIQSPYPILGVFNTAAQDPYGTNLLAEVVRHDAEDIIAFTPGNWGPDKTVEDSAVAELYRAADMLLVMSLAEGFCLPILEAMASRTLAVAPDAYSATELLQGRGVLYASGPRTTAGLNGWATVPDPVDATDALVRGIRVLKEGSPELGHPASVILDRAEAFARSRSWTACYQGIAEMIAPATPAPRWPSPGARAADGGAMDSLLRWRARQRAEGRFGVVKMGGLGDMLMATRVIREAAKQYGLTATVFCNGFQDVFTAMPEVDDVVLCHPAAQADITRSVADEFELFLDLRLPSRAYGPLAPPASDLSVKYRWMTDGHVPSLQRLATLGMHATEVMLRSLNLPTTNLRPIYEARAEVSDEMLVQLDRAVIVAPGAGGLGRLKQPSMVWWQELLTHLTDAIADDGRSDGAESRPVIQSGAFDEPLIPGCIDARGWGLPVTASLVAHAAQVIAVESGLAHLAHAVRDHSHQAQTIVLFGPTPLAPFAYPEHVNLSTQECPPCFFSANWVDQVCALGEPSCINLPPISEVVKHVVLR